MVENQGMSQKLPKISTNNIYKFHSRLFKVGQLYLIGNHNGDIGNGVPSSRWGPPPQIIQSRNQWSTGKFF